MGEVSAVDRVTRSVQVDGVPFTYDYLVIALGGVTSYFGRPEWESVAPGLKSLSDALRIRKLVLEAFERAEVTEDAAERERLLTMVVVGGGPTGVEMAGSFRELAKHALVSDFRCIHPEQARVILVEAGPRILSSFPEDLSESARRQLEILGVEVRTECVVQEMRPGELVVSRKTERSTIGAATIVWAAGVGAVPLTRNLGYPVDRTGRLIVSPDLSLVNSEGRVYAIGDIAACTDASGRSVPGVSPGAMQMGIYVARRVAQLVRGPWESAAQATPFLYRDKGSMATIGRSAAVVVFGRIKLSGMFAWLSWLFIHLVFLIGFRNKISVFLQWTYSYWTFRKGARIVTR